MAPGVTAASRPRLVSLEIRGFRAFGTEARTLLLDAPLVVVHAGNSQGKTSLAEGIEFLLSGQSSRRELLGGAKAEYNDSLRNAHLPTTSADVYVEAVLRCVDGSIRCIRRELLCDFGQGTECDSRLLVDGVEVADLSGVGLPLADPPVRAPVLLQHTLRHVLSTEPKQRVNYFKALLSLTDLDDFRTRVRAARNRIEAEPIGDALKRLEKLTGTPAAAAGPAITALAKKSLAVDAVRTVVDAQLLRAGTAVLTSPDSGDGPLTFDAIDDLTAAISAAMETQREQVFPLSAFRVGALMPDTPTNPDISDYVTALSEVDQRAASLTPLFSAVLSIDTYAELTQPVQCPVCGTDDTLSPERIALLQDYLQRTRALDAAAATVAAALSKARHNLEQFGNNVATTVPSIVNWTDEQHQNAADALRDLNIDGALLAGARSQASQIAGIVSILQAAVASTCRGVDQAGHAVAGRKPVPNNLIESFTEIDTATANLVTAIENYRRDTDVLRTAVEAAARSRITFSGLTEMADLLERRADIVADVVAESQRQLLIKRLNGSDKQLRDAAGVVLDTRFEQMSDTITEWWGTIRPEELVGFGGVKRRAGGALFVNLVAALHADIASPPVERDALGVYSDSQLNALGLSLFLARNELLGSPIVVLDDPIPGSDSDHRLTFVQNTLGRLLDAGIQVIITTFDNKLAEFAQANYGGADYMAYKLDLLNIVAGTEATQATDVFAQFMLEGEDHLNSPTAKGRRAACGNYRSAAERLAKQIIATGQTAAGTTTAVADFEAKGLTLGTLVPLVLPFVVDGSSEKGQWKTFAKVLNPGNHDDDVPSTGELKQVRGNLRTINKSHQKHWPGGLLQ
ncbi:AAA family ATPase [Mycobacteroides chelonae]|uniref:AAA family ATPase n=1 Tax=Mycobacteroides chelonae TaxID=1774 RepID=UPI0009923C4B|nr:AAA family ATPase [Mycobacteroides chelonae]